MLWALRRRRHSILAVTASAILIGVAVLLFTVIPSYGVTQLEGGPTTPQAQVGPAVTDQPISNQSEVKEPGVVQVADKPTSQLRAPYTPPVSPSLELELNIPHADLAQLPGPEPLVLAPHTNAVVTVTKDSQALAQLYFQAINQVRQEKGLAPLAWDADLVARAEGYASTRLWYWSMDERGSVWEPLDDQIRAYFGVQHPDYVSIGVSSGLAPTSVLEGAPNAEHVLEIIQGAGYGATGDSGAKAVGVSLVMLENSTADVPVGWFAIFYQ